MKKNKKVMFTFMEAVIAVAILGCGGSSKKNSETTSATSSSPLDAHYVMKFAHIFPGNGNEQKWFKYAADKIADQSGNHVEIQIFADAQLGDEAELTPQVLAGDLDMSFSGPSVWADAMRLPEYGFSELPYIVTNYDQMNKLGRVLPDICNQMSEKAGLDVECIGAMSQGLRCVMTTDKEIKTVKDMVGVKIRVPQSEMYVKTVESFGASATVMPSSELYSALQQGVVGAYENDPATAVARNLHEVLKFYSTTNHIASLNVLLVSKKSMAKIPAEYQKIIKDVFGDACAQQLDDRVIENNKLVKTMEDAGMKITELTDEQRQGFIDSVKPMQDEYIKKYHLEDVFSQIDKIIK